MHLDTIIGRLETSERFLADAFLLISDRHSRDAEIRDVARTIAAWPSEHLDALARARKKYGTKVTTQPDRLRAALFHDPRVGPLGLIEDLHDLDLLVQQVLLLWTELGQAARARFDHELAAACAQATDDAERQHKWILMQIKLASPQALAVRTVKRRELAASVPRTVSAAALPDTIWGPAAVLVAIGALLGARLRPHGASQGVGVVSRAVIVGLAGVAVRAIRSGRFRRRREAARTRTFEPAIRPS